MVCADETLGVALFEWSDAVVLIFLATGEWLVEVIADVVSEGAIL
jgi:hypothetical protein